MRFFFFQAEDGIRDWSVTGVQTLLFHLTATATGPLNRAALPVPSALPALTARSEERRVGKECTAGWPPDDKKEQGASGGGNTRKAKRRCNGHEWNLSC